MRRRNSLRRVVGQSRLSRVAIAWVLAAMAGSLAGCGEDSAPNSNDLKQPTFPNDQPTFTPSVAPDQPTEETSDHCPFEYAASEPREFEACGGEPFGFWEVENIEAEHGVPVYFGQLGSMSSMCKGESAKVGYSRVLFHLMNEGIAQVDWDLSGVSANFESACVSDALAGHACTSLPASSCEEACGVCRCFIDDFRLYDVDRTEDESGGGFESWERTETTLTVTGNGTLNGRYCVKGDRMEVLTGSGLLYSAKRYYTVDEPTACATRSAETCKQGCIPGICTGDDELCAEEPYKTGCLTIQGCSWDETQCSGEPDSCLLSDYGLIPGCEKLEHPPRCEGEPTACEDFPRGGAGCYSNPGCDLWNVGCIGTAVPCSEVPADTCATAGCTLIIETDELTETESSPDGGASNGSDESAPVATADGGDADGVDPTDSTGVVATSDGTNGEQDAGATTPLAWFFVVDVSASMVYDGAEDSQLRAIKWDALARALTTFTIEAPPTDVASMTFFPNAFALTVGQVEAAMTAEENAPVEVCDWTLYAEADVPLTALPSELFATALRDISPDDPLDWRWSTPTAPVLMGARYQVSQLAQTSNIKPVVVFITDGLPYGCDTDAFGDAHEVFDAVASSATSFSIFLRDTSTLSAEEPLTLGEPGINSFLIDVEDANVERDVDAVLRQIAETAR